MCMSARRTARRAGEAKRKAAIAAEPLHHRARDQVPNGATNSAPRGLPAPAGRRRHASPQARLAALAAAAGRGARRQTKHGVRWLTRLAVCRCCCCAGAHGRLELGVRVPNRRRDISHGAQKSGLADVGQQQRHVVVRLARRAGRGGREQQQQQQRRRRRAQTGAPVGDSGAFARLHAVVASFASCWLCVLASHTHTARAIYIKWPPTPPPPARGARRAEQPTHPPRSFSCSPSTTSSGCYGTIGRVPRPSAPTPSSTTRSRR